MTKKGLQVFWNQIHFLEEKKHQMNKQTSASLAKKFKNLPSSNWRSQMSRQYW